MTQKKLIICCDGTWNEPESKHDDRAVPTNVLKLMRAIKPNDSNGCPQVVYYHEGVGTANWWDKFVGGAFGIGLNKNVVGAYRFIANNYADNDEIYCFGFSRGAYTARSLGGLIGTIGLLDTGDMEYLPQCYAYYRTKPENRARSRHHQRVQKLARRSVTIKCIGVWDTVGALGVPTPMLGWISRRLWVGFHNTSLGVHIERAYHAVAIDERRRPFAADLWTLSDDPAEEAARAASAEQTVLQVWFPGAHSNVGGGYPDAGLSDLAFEWMLNRARESGLEFDAGFLSEKENVDPNVEGKLVNSFTLPYQALRLLRVPRYTRPVGPRQLDSIKKTPGLNEKIDEHVIARMENKSLEYAPDNVLRALDAGTPIFRERAAPRERLENCEATLSGYPDTACRILDRSTGGLCLESPTQLKLGDDVEIASGPTGTVRGRVVWSASTRAGIRLAA